MLTFYAPAKINLTLEVLAKRQDGFHEIRSVIQTIDVGDILHFQLSQNIEFKSDGPVWVPEASLVSKAVKLVQKTTRCSNGVVVEVKKRTPLLSGLGGDSSDAAATLRGLNELWGLGLSPMALLGLASQLGSDVGFFLYGGTALVSGRGEVVTPLPPLPHRWVVLVVPSVGRTPGKTGRLYHSLKASNYTDGQITEKLVRQLKMSKEFTLAPFNTFENLAFARSSELKVWREHIAKLGVDSVHLAGSGPTLFTLFRDKSQAEELYLRCQQQGMETYLTETLAAIDQPD
ncbi:4-(cytidine 5'-diphospho)-2-C-methyl-D-erythritol kinase [Chloroflexota bacterium]